MCIYIYIYIYFLKLEKTTTKFLLLKVSCKTIFNLQVNDVTI